MNDIKVLKLKSGHNIIFTLIDGNIEHCLEYEYDISSDEIIFNLFMDHVDNIIIHDAAVICSGTPSEDFKKLYINAIKIITEQINNIIH